MDLLLDVNIVLDVCAHRSSFAELSAAALVHCTNTGGRLWLYTGSVQTLEYNLIRELKLSIVGVQPTNKQLMIQARAVLKAFAVDKQWLAALPEEGAVFDSEDPEDEQLIRALDRFTPGTIKLLTRDRLLCERNPELTVTPQEILQTKIQPKPIDFIDLKSQQDLLRSKLDKNIHRVLHHGQYIMGPEVTELEEKLAAYVGVKHCITASSGTDTLLIALMALGIGPGDEVITSPFTFIATGEMIALTGAKPVFVDIDPRTYNIDPDLIEAAITARTKAIMPVSLYGQCADFDAINAIAEKHTKIRESFIVNRSSDKQTTSYDTLSTNHDPRIYVIEDGAQSFGATYKGRRSCGLSSIGSTSFFPSKPLGCYGDGGALFTDDDILAASMRQIRAHGQDRRYHHPRIGINGRMDTLQAAVLLAKLEIFDDEVEDRARIGARYTELIKAEPRTLNSVVTPYIESYNTSVYAQYTVQVENRDAVQKRLQEQNIPTAVHYPVPLHLQPVFDGLNQSEGRFPVAEAAARRVMSLPMHPYLDKDEQDDIVASLQRAIA